MKEVSAFIGMHVPSVYEDSEGNLYTLYENISYNGCACDLCPFGWEDNGENCNSAKGNPGMSCFGGGGIMFWKKADKGREFKKENCVGWMRAWENQE